MRTPRARPASGHNRVDERRAYRRTPCALPADGASGGSAPGERAKKAPARAVLAACVLLVLAACGTSTTGDRAAGGSAAGSSPTNEAHDSFTQFGQKYRFGSGIMVSVSEPTTFQPSDAAYPPSSNAVAFEVWIRNETGHPYRMSNMSVTVTVNGRDARQIIDPTQGYTGVVGSGKGLPTDREQQVDLAFAMPADPASLRVTFQPHKTRRAGVTYVGKAAVQESR